jgi:hypothetical protein
VRQPGLPAQRLQAECRDGKGAVAAETGAAQKPGLLASVYKLIPATEIKVPLLQRQGQRRGQGYQPSVSELTAVCEIQVHLLQRLGQRSSQGCQTGVSKLYAAKNLPHRPAAQTPRRSCRKQRQTDHLYRHGHPSTCAYKERDQQTFISQRAMIVQSPPNLDSL